GRRSELLCRALPPRVAAASAHRRDAGRSVRRRLVAESTRRPLDLLCVARAGSARVGGRAGAEGSGEVVELCAVGEGGHAYARIGRAAKRASREGRAEKGEPRRASREGRAENCEPKSATK